MSELTQVQQELYNALLNTCHISDEASVLLKNWITNSNNNISRQDYDLLAIYEYHENAVEDGVFTTINNNFEKIFNIYSTDNHVLNENQDIVNACCIFHNLDNNVYYISFNIEFWYRKFNVNQIQLMIWTTIGILLTAKLTPDGVEELRQWKPK